MRDELSKSDQDLKTILELVGDFRRALESLGHPDDWDNSDEVRLSNDLFADASKLLQFAMAGPGRQPSGLSRRNSAASSHGHG